MLTASDLAAMRATAARALPDTTVVQRVVTSSDGGGGETEAWEPDPAAVRCRIAPLGGGEGGNAGGRISDETTHVVTLDAEADISELDRLVMGDTTYEITVVRERGQWELTRRVEVREAP